jgi:cobyrinic acid a,c-diamide synthase
MDCVGLVLAGTHSGCGKTMVTLGLAAALRSQGVRVQGFKVGPDFIDPSHLAAITGRAVHNLDGWMLSRQTVLEIFQRYAADADVCLVEGVMGLYDGASGVDESGSTAQMAKWLGLPVALVVNARSQGRSVAALVRGFRDFDQELNLAGVIFTQVGSPGHQAMLRQAMEAHVPALPCLGFLPRKPELTLPSRHLGLYMAGEVDSVQQRQALADWAQQEPELGLGLNLDLINDLAARNCLAVGRSCSERTVGVRPEVYPEVYPEVCTEMHWAARPKVRLAVARDRAFCFFYQENLRLLEEAGATLVFFSPLEDQALPSNVHGLYLAGGYPELHAATLAANQAMRDSVRTWALAGMPVYAECGGLLYLLDQLEDAGHTTHAMVGLLPGRAEMHDRFQALGYRRVTLTADCLLGPANTVLRGHEFHYSGLCQTEDADRMPARDAGFEPVYHVVDRRGREYLEGFARQNILASYIHLHFSSQPLAAAALVQACALWAETRGIASQHSIQG